MDHCRWNTWIQISIILASISVVYTCQGRTCGECVSSGATCAWCTDKVFGRPDDRCGTYDQLQKTCSPENIISPNNTIDLIENRTLSDNEHVQSITQVQPQNIHIRLRPNSSVSFPFRYQAARNYPVDIYFLFDLSNTMSDHKNKLGSVVDTIALEIGSISTNYRLGFGCFQDKVALPFTSTLAIRLANPCDVDSCAPPFGYKHKLNFTTDSELFRDVVIKSNVTGNIDTPEGGLDAIMQAITCEKELDWRKESRRLLVYSSDSTFHTAGDGKLAGIVRPNDGLCHLNAKGENPEELNMDYPSIGQIRNIVSNKKVYVIFAIADRNALSDYEKLTDGIATSSVDTLDEDSVVKIVRNTYEEILSKVSFRVSAPPHVTVELRSKCGDSTEMKTSSCKDLKIGQTIDFDVKVMVSVCPSNPADRKMNVTISPIGLPETMTITLEVICDCDCEVDEVEPTDDECSSGNGTTHCGVCSCNEGRYGELCECDNSDLTDDSRKCRSSNTTDRDCSGRGTCQCGVCNCIPGFSGQFCQCHDSRCPKVNGLTCGGPSRGQCSCETCNCNEGYEGHDCGCAISQDMCMPMADGELCSGHGDCLCGECKCKGDYIGDYCDKCPTCPGACQAHLECVNCAVFKTGRLTSEECSMTCSHVQTVDLLADGDKGICELKDVDGCMIKFKVVIEDGNTTIYAQKLPECEKDVALLPIIAGVVGGIVALGLLLLLLWKLLTSVYDKREYAKFKLETDDPLFGQITNPLFKDPTVTYQNPRFEKSCVLLSEDKL